MTDDQRGARALEIALLGSAAELTREQVEGASPRDAEATRRLWRALGFVDLEPGVPSLTEADADALRRTHALVADQGVDERVLIGLARTLGQTMGRLAEAQVDTVTDLVARDPDLMARALQDGDEVVTDLIPILTPVFEQLQELLLYVWRRHLVGAGQRALAGASTDAEAAPLVVGFADIVGYTSATRDMTSADLATLVEGFEDRAFEAVQRGGGRVIKTLGDEIMFTARTPDAGATVGLALAAAFTDGPVPPVRVGLAYGPAVSRAGDVFGPVVNIASRCTGLARPSTVLVDRTLAAALDGPAWTLRKLPPQRVRGYDHLLVSVLRAARDSARG